MKLTHSEATATLRPFGSMAMYRTGTPAAAVKGASNWQESLEYLRTSVSSLLENQQSSYSVHGHHQLECL